jgi:CRP/FNR family cyclic AMP-dependent transcriptional regulator
VILANRYSPSPSNMFGRALHNIGQVSKPLLRRSAVEKRAHPYEPGAIRPARALPPDATGADQALPQIVSASAAPEIDPLYLFACHVLWENAEEPSSAWELIAAAQSSHGDTRAHARALLASSHHLGPVGAASVPPCSLRPKRSDGVADMKTLDTLPPAENCAACVCARPGSFCAFSPPVLRILHQVSHKSTLPAGAILFVEGQAPRGMFILCSGRVNLSTTSREGKILILKTAEPGEALGLSSAICGSGYETTAETATPCQLNFLDREHLLDLMQTYSEVSMRAAHCLSRDFHSAYRDIHDLVLTRSSAGKLARLLLSQSPLQDRGPGEVRISSSMTHEEMAQRIGSSRETVTRLLCDLRKKRLIHLEGPTLVIRDRDALEALAV